MRRPKIVVSDLSVVVDLAEVKLIGPIVGLPFEFVIPDVILAGDLIDLCTYSAAELLQLGFVEGALDGAETRCACDYFRQHRRRLSFSDCFAWRLAEFHRAILLTGDANLGAVAASVDIEVRGLLWAVEMMAKHEISNGKVLAEALDRLGSNPRGRLPEAEIRALREKLRAGQNLVCVTGIDLADQSPTESIAAVSSAVSELGAADGCLKFVAEFSLRI